MPSSFPCWRIKCVSAVPVHPVGLPYRVPSPQEQDSLRVLQYVEKQLAHFNPARSLSHQCKSHDCILELSGSPVQHADSIRMQCMFCSVGHLLALFFSGSVLSCTPFHLGFDQISCRTVVHVYSSEQILCFNNLRSFLQSLADPELNTSQIFLKSDSLLNRTFFLCPILCYFVPPSLQPVWT